MPPDQITVPADPGPFGFDPVRTALLLIDMQRDFVEPGGFGETLGNDVSLLQAVIPPLREVLAATRAAGMTACSRLTSLPNVSPKPPGSTKSRCMSMSSSAVRAGSQPNGPGSAGTVTWSAGTWSAGTVVSHSGDIHRGGG